MNIPLRYGAGRRVNLTLIFSDDDTRTNEQVLIDLATAAVKDGVTIANVDIQPPIEPFELEPPRPDPTTQRMLELLERLAPPKEPYLGPG